MARWLLGASDFKNVVRLCADPENPSVRRDGDKTIRSQSVRISQTKLKVDDFAADCHRIGKCKAVAGTSVVEQGVQFFSCRGPCFFPLLLQDMQGYRANPAIRFSDLIVPPPVRKDQQSNDSHQEQNNSLPLGSSSHKQCPLTGFNGQ